ncbi:inverse autotransporter beta domain-containing protein [Synechococcus sp. LTW-R]|uniref:inverse autotransporter beta domain-containing protein n=1 Tax=Synechococcus sp. LTW-R TaxID=2751170 RepID=UPI002103A047|nr:inverse autotransporter beta domain-containing protein [Synechococcus sp. LTW-R]
MQQSLRLSLAALGTAALSLASLPAVSAKPAQVAQGSASDLGVMSISLKDVVKPRVGVQAQTQAAGTPNQAGLGGFLPLVVGSNSVFFADLLANANFADINNSSSIINTTVAGTTISTSSRLGYRWLNGDRSWMYGVNAGYDTRPMSTGPADTGITVYASRTAFFQQAAVNAEAVSDQWAFNAYALIPTGDTEQVLNTVYQGGALDTYGLDAGYNLTPALRASVGYYYQNGDCGNADGSGVLGRLDYAINNGLTVGTNLSYDSTFKSRFSADIKWRFNTNGGPGKETRKTNTAVTALTSTPSNRDVRVHDSGPLPGCVQPDTCSVYVCIPGSPPVCSWYCLDCGA